MPSETERITNAFLDRHDFGKLTERLGRAYVELGQHSNDLEGSPHLANAVCVEAAVATDKRPFRLRGFLRDLLK